MITPTEPLAGVELDTAAELIDACRNLNGSLPADARARLFAVIDTPSEVTWLKARSLIISQSPATTLWQAVIHVGLFPEVTPRRVDVIHALTMTALATKTSKK